MTNEEIAKIYKEGNAQNHTEGLRAVFNAGRDYDASEEARLAEEERLNSEQKALEEVL